MTNRQSLSIIIVGTGFGGLCMGAKLKRAGRDDFIILEKADAVGGTWRENRYPGAECDVGSRYYSYSFFPNPDWDHRWAKQPQILQYLNDFTDAGGLRDHIYHGKTVDEAVYDELAKRWNVKTTDGSAYEAQHFILALGQLHHPSFPHIEGKDKFSGQQFHTAEWPDDLDLTGKNIGMIGNAASAIQAAPKLAEIADHLTIYQRSANWMIPKGDRSFFRIEKWLARYFPGFLKFCRYGWYLTGELVFFPMIQGEGWRAKVGEWVCKASIRWHIKDPELRKKLVPDYPIGAKRVLIADDYYPALARENVTVETRAVARFTKSGIETSENTERRHDVVVYATGFKTDPFYSKLSIQGEGGQALQSHWSDGAKAYSGVMTAGFPNMFMLYGPNTNTGHTSIVFKLENQVNYILQLIEKTGKSSIFVRGEAEEKYDEEMQFRLNKSAWAKVENSWYKQKGRIANNWPGSGREYKRRMKTPIWADYEIG